MDLEEACESTDVQRSSLKRSQHHLKQLIGDAVSERFDLNRRGLAFFVDEVEAHGQPPERILVWASLHFLPKGSPFCCSEPSCHVPLIGCFRDQIEDTIRRQMGLTSGVEVEFMAIRAAVHEGVLIDDVLASMTPVPSADDIDQRDALGRTALMRAAARGYDRQVEQLLEAGANPSVVDDRGRGALDVARGTWIISMIEQAVALRNARAIQRP